MSVLPPCRRCGQEECATIHMTASGHDFEEPNPCGHADMVRGCGGCDPGAIEFVIHDDGTVHKPEPHETSIHAQDDACHECPASEFEWSDTLWVDGAPVMVCREHGHRAPGHVYEVNA